MKASAANPYEGYSLPLVLVDLAPVLLFALSAGIVARRFSSRLFSIGICLVIAAGLLKVIWKLIVTVSHRDIRILSRQLRYLMPAGFFLTLIGILVKFRRISWSALFAGILSFPAVLFFILGLIGICFMVSFARKAGETTSEVWKEELTNSAAQLMFLIGILTI
jgi:hypothetical protein